MDKNQFWKYQEQLKDGEALIVFHDGNVTFKNKDGKRHHFGKIADGLQEQIIPIKVKPFARPPQKGKRSFFKFGTTLPKYVKKGENSKLVQKWLTIFNLIKELDVEPKKSVWVDTFMRLSYDVEELGEVKVYYFKGTPRYVEFRGKKLIIDQTKDANKDNPNNILFDPNDR